MDLPRDEIAFRKRYEPLVRAGALTTVFRPGVRVFPARRGYIPGEIVTARIIETPGCDLEGRAPVFGPYARPVRIRELAVRTLWRLSPADFEGSSPDVMSIEELYRHLYDIYGRPIEAYTHLVTRIALQYFETSA